MSTFRVRLTQGDVRTGGGSADRVSQLQGSVSGATNATPVVITTSAAHGLSSGTRVTISNVGGNEGANGDFVITVLSSTTFSLNDSVGTDSYTSGGNWRVDSVQRTMYVAGPNQKYRKLKDGEEFEDCNFWKQYAYPVVPYNEAIVEVVSDDGSVYSAGSSGNFVVTYSKTLVSGSTYTTTNNIIDILDDHGGYAVWAIITTDDDITVRINDSSSSDFTVLGDTSHQFNNGDVLISTVKFAKSSSGSAAVTLQVGVQSKCNS